MRPLGSVGSIKFALALWKETMDEGGQDNQHARMPKRSGGQFSGGGTVTDLLMRYSRNQKPAKDFLRWIHDEGAR